VEDIFALLQKRAISNGARGWCVYAYPDYVAVAATTRSTANDEDGAWELAKALLANILDLGYEVGPRCQLGAVGERGPKTGDMAWRGCIDVRLRTPG
jgi:hypothetical protein